MSIFKRPVPNGGGETWPTDLWRGFPCPCNIQAYFSNCTASRSVSVGLICPSLKGVDVGVVGEGCTATAVEFWDEDDGAGSGAEVSAETYSRPPSSSGVDHTCRLLNFGSSFALNACMPWYRSLDPGLQAAAHGTTWAYLTSSLPETRRIDLEWCASYHRPDKTSSQPTLNPCGADAITAQGRT